MNKKELQDTYRKLQKKQREIAKMSPVYLSQKDFSEGTYLITEPGYYVLKEDIVFSPNPDNDYLPKKDNPKYSTLGFSLGFFAVILIATNDVYLNLNGYTISASRAFVLQQRFFSLIELADSPFLPNEGPGNFSKGIVCAENVIIGNGTLGLSSHHGIHGNLNSNILLEKLKIKDFEFVGIALNGSKNIVLSKLEIGPNLQDSPVLATYSAGRFAKMFSEHLLNRNVLSQEQKNTLIQKLDKLKEEMDTTFHEAMSNQRITSDLFRNESRLPDGNIYGIMIKDKGVGVNDFVDRSEKKTENVYLRKIGMKDLKCRVDEVVGLSGKGGKGVQNDVAGAVLQIDKLTNSEGYYRGTVLSEVQLYLAELALSLGSTIGKNNITLDVINWAKNGSSIKNLLSKGYKYKCSSDSMGHINKGILGYRLDACDNLWMKKIYISSLTNKGRLGNDQLAGKYDKSHDAAKLDGYHGANSIGINLSSCSRVKISKFSLEKIKSSNGNAIGIRTIFSSDAIISKGKIQNIKAGKLRHGKWRGKDYDGNLIEYKGTKPNMVPQAIGILVEKGCKVSVFKTSIHDLKSCGKEEKILRK